MITNASTDAAALNMRGVAEMMGGKLETSIATFDRALAAQPTLLEARFNRGVALLKLNRLQAAATEFETVAAAGGPLAAAAAYHRAIAADALGDFAAAGTWLEKALAAKPGYDDALLLLGVIREKQSDYQSAGRAYKEYLSRNPGSISAMLRFGIAAHATGHIETAKRYLRQVIAAAPGTPEAAEATKFMIMWD